MGEVGRAACILTSLYVRRSQFSSGSKVDPDEFPLGADGSKSEGLARRDRMEILDLNTTQNALEM